MKDERSASESTHPRLASQHQEVLSRYLEPLQLAAGEQIIHEGALEHAMYFVIEGEAEVSRGQVQVNVVQSGGHFGEFGLIFQRPRSASVVAMSDLKLLKLSAEAYQRLIAEAPEVAHRLLEVILYTTGRRLAEMTESVSVLIKNRSLSRRATLRVWTPDGAQVVKNGSPIQDLLPQSLQGETVVAARLDHRPVSLSTRVTGDCEIEALTTAHWEGRRVFHHSLALLLIEAAGKVCPDRKLTMGASVGFAQRAVLSPAVPVDELPALAARIDRAMHALSDAKVPLVEESWSIEEAREFFLAAEDYDAAELLSMRRSPMVRVVSYGRQYALEMGPLVPNTGLIQGFKLVAGDDALILLYELDIAKAKAAFTVSVPLVAATETEPPGSADTMDVMNEARLMSRRSVVLTSDQNLWLGAMGITSVGAFNRASVDGDVRQLIRVSEGSQERRIASIADAIAARRGDIKLISVAGPSSSGKTTFIERLSVQLQVNGLNPVSLSLDNYYVDRENTPKLPNGEYDFENLEALQLDLLSEHLTKLSMNHEVQSPLFDFAAGKSRLEGGKRLRLAENDLLLIEGIHGLNPRLIEELPEHQVFKIFICPLAQLPFDRATRVHASDVRLIRRIVRDRHGRNLTAAETIRRWPAVRDAERTHIFPYQEHADQTFDSSLIYELAVLKVYAERYLLEIPQNHPSLTTSVRLLRLLDDFVPIYSEHVPQNSLLREFIGNSSFDEH